MNLRYQKWWTIISIVFAANCKAQLSNIIQATPNRRIPIAWSIKWEADTNVMKRKYDSIADWATANNDHLLYYYTKLAALQYMADKPLTENHHEHTLLSQMNYFENSGIEEIKGGYYFIIGNMYFHYRNYEKAFKYIVKSADIFDQIGFSKIPIAAYYGTNLFGFYFSFEDYTSALKYARVCLDYPDTVLVKPIFVLNNLGVAQLKLKHFESAAATFHKVMAMAGAAKDSLYYGIGSGNYGNALRLQGKFQEALPFLYTDVRLNSKTERSNSAISCLYISYCLLKLDSLSKAALYLQAAKDYFATQTHATHGWPVNSLGLNYYETSALYYQKTGDYKRASFYQDTLSYFKDSLKNVFNARIVMANTLRSKEEKILADQKKAKQEAVNIKLVRNVIIGSMTIVFMVIIIGIQRKRNRENRLASEKQIIVEGQLKMATEKLDKYLTNLREKSAFIENLETELQNFQTKEMKEKADKQLQQLYNSVILTEENWLTFKHLIGEVWPGFFDRIHEKYPGLSRGEERLLALCKLNISSKEMAGMIGISVSSLRMSRYRLRQKFPSLIQDEEFKDLV